MDLQPIRRPSRDAPLDQHAFLVVVLLVRQLEFEAAHPSRQQTRELGARERNTDTTPGAVEERHERVVARRAAGGGFLVVGPLGYPSVRVEFVRVGSP